MGIREDSERSSFSNPKEKITPLIDRARCGESLSTMTRDVASLQKENTLLKEELEKNKSENKMIKAWICAKDAKASLCK